MIHSMLAQVLDQDARARLNTLKISKPEKAEMVSNFTTNFSPAGLTNDDIPFQVEKMIIQMAQQGRLGGKIDDAQLVQLLESLSQQMPRSTSKVNFDRRRANIDSDDEDDYGIQST